MKQLKDYLHFYLGCDVMTPDGVRPLIGFGILGIVYVKTFPKEISPSTAYFTYHETVIKPILRPISDICKEEKKVLADEAGMYRFDDDEERVGTADNYLKANEFTPSQTRYLLWKHFDLFNLIESGLAIDKTLLTLPVS